MTNQQALDELKDLAGLIDEAESIIASLFIAAEDENDSTLLQRAGRLEQQLLDAREEVAELEALLES
jgi:hypothetical protein